ncbi:MAG TPA: hypothetical protein VGA70_07480 [Longimicrobiales bacterium]|jgi:hypothetical protein
MRTKQRRGRRLASLAQAVTLAAALGGALACEDGSGPVGETVTLLGTVTEADGGEPVEGLYVHLLYGIGVASAYVAGDDTDADGAYLVSGVVPAESCHLVRLAVSAEAEFDPFATSIATRTVGRCGAGVVHFTVPPGSGGG